MYLLLEFPLIVLNFKIIVLSYSVELLETILFYLMSKIINSYSV